MTVRRHRNILKRVFLNESEEIILKENMQRFGIWKFSTYARRTLLFPNIPIITVELSGYHQLANELKRIGNNLNQLSRIANQSNQIDVAVVGQLQELVEEMSRKMKKEMEVEIKKVESLYGGH